MMAILSRPATPEANATPAGTPTLSVRDLSVEFPTRHGVLVATRDISFDIQPGEVLGMVGESGAGKSLTGMAVIGLLEPPGRLGGGEIHLAGKRIDNLPPKARQRLRCAGQLLHRRLGRQRDVGQQLSAYHAAGAALIVHHALRHESGIFLVEILLAPGFRRFDEMRVGIDDGSIIYRHVYLLRNRFSAGDRLAHRAPTGREVPG